jgi:hypothetical protein
MAVEHFLKKDSCVRPSQAVRETDRSEELVLVARHGSVAGSGASREVELVFGLGLEAVEDLTERAGVP